MDLEFLSAILFYLLLFLFFYKNRKKVRVISKIVLGYKTKRGISFMKKIAEHRALCKLISTIYIPIALYFTFVISSQLILNTYFILTKKIGPTIAFVIPGVRIPGSPIFFPFWYTVISIAILAIIHEFSHGIVALSERIRVKDAGFGLFLIFFLAFVEPHEGDMKKRSRLSRIRVASAGPVSNILTALLIGALIFSLDPLLSNFFSYEGVKIVKVMEGYPAQEAGLKDGMVILGLENFTTQNITSFSEALSSFKPNQTIKVLTNEGEFNLTLTGSPQNESIPYMGIYLSQAWSFKEQFLGRLSYVLFGLPYFRLGTYDKGLLGWLAFLSFLVGIMNLLPIFALDGSIIVYNLLSYLIRDEKHLNLVCSSIFYFFLILLIFNIIGPYLL
ncbi:MAG: site-2 protease family protein [Nanoarchaeota archaeon]|nr:site-2 protease family protein [Nanoarchaeota archaeon]